MGERSDGTWSAKQVGVSAPRQNGKSQLIVARALAGALLFDEKKIVISAHSQDTARETFAKFVEQIDTCPALEERIAPRGIMNALNREKITFANGAVVQFKARTVSGSRGFSSDCLLLDEAQILGMPAWVSINSTMSARPNPQIWLLGTPPTPEDNGEVFTSIRGAALGGRSTTLAWLEWAADPSDDPALAETRAKANPAWWTRINHEVVQGEYETYPPERFALDRLGIWRSDRAALIMPDWPLRASHEEAKPLALGVAVDVDRTWASIAAAGEGQVGAVRRDRLGAWLVADVVEIAKRRGLPVAIDGGGPAASLVDQLEAAGITVLRASLDDYKQACADLFDGIATGSTAHHDDDDLNAAVTAAGWRKVGDRLVWSRKSGDVSMLEAATLALWGTANAGPTREFWGAIG